MNKLDRTYEFAKMYYDWVYKCLVEDEKYEELAFFKLGIDLMVRQKELIRQKRYEEIEKKKIQNKKHLTKMC